MYIHALLKIKMHWDYRPFIAGRRRKHRGLVPWHLLARKDVHLSLSASTLSLHPPTSVSVACPPDLSFNSINHVSTMIDLFSAVQETGVASYWFHSSPLPVQIPNHYRNTWSQIHSMHNEVWFNLPKCWCMGRDIMDNIGAHGLEIL